MTPGRLALAWLLAQDDAVVPIAGSRTPAHIEENVAAAHLALDATTLEEVDTRLAGAQPGAGRCSTTERRRGAAKPYPGRSLVWLSR